MKKHQNVGTKSAFTPKINNKDYYYYYYYFFCETSFSPLNR